MLRYPQHIKKYCDEETFRELESNTRTFEVKVNDIPIDNGDFITFVELDAEKNETGRSVMKHVTCLQTIESVPFNQEDVIKHGLLVVGFEAPEETTLKNFFDENFVMAFVVDVVNEDWTISEGPNYWPMLMCPPLLEVGIVDELKMGKWPTGVYSVHIKIKPTVEDVNKPISLEVIDTFILAMVEGEGESKETVIGHPIDVTSLIIGKCVTVHGQSITPTAPDRVASFYQDTDILPEPEELDVMDFDELTREDLDAMVERSGMPPEQISRVMEDFDKAQKAKAK